MKDPILDSDASRNRISDLYFPINVVFVLRLPPAYQGAICWIWAKLASYSVNSGDDFFILLGDDVTIHDDDWQADVEEQFDLIAGKNSSLPYGCGCVAIRDAAFPNFPTFPVLHKFHLEAFGGDLFPFKLPEPARRSLPLRAL